MHCNATGFTVWRTTKTIVYAIVVPHSMDGPSLSPGILNPGSSPLDSHHMNWLTEN